MNTREKNKDEMLGTVCEFYDVNKDAVSVIPATATVFSDLKAIHKEVGLNEKIIQDGTTGKIESRDVSQAEIVKISLVLSGAIYGYAASKNDVELMKFADLNSKSFSRLRDSEIPLVAEKIIDKCDELGDELISYGVTVDKRTAAHDLLNDYIEKFGGVLTGKGTKKTARETIIMLLKKADQKLKVLDRLMLGFKESSPELYSKYEAARVIYDKTGTRKAAVAEPAPTS